MSAATSPTADPQTVPTGPMRRIAAFRPGTWDGRPVTADHLRGMVENFKQLSTGDQPYYKPFVSLNHKDTLRFGTVTAADLDGDETLYLDADDVPEPVRLWAKGGQLEAPSVEFWEPGDFVMPDGSKNQSPVLKCVTFLGNKAPAVKGLPPLASAKFADPHKARRFSARPFSPGVPPMDRTTMLQTLQGMAPEVAALVTDAIPDELLAAIVAMCQKANANPPPPPAEPTQMSDQLPAPGSAGVTVPSVGGGPDPKAITLKFADASQTRALGGYLAGLQAQLNGLVSNTNALAAQTAVALQDAKRQKVRAFRDEMCGGGGRAVAYMTPAQFDALEPLLLACDDVRVRKFADGRHEGTDLAETFARIRAANAKAVRTFGDQAPDPLRGPAGTDSGLTPADKTAMLRATPLGRAALDRQKAAARN